MLVVSLINELSKFAAIPKETKRKGVEKFSPPREDHSGRKITSIDSDLSKLWERQQKTKKYRLTITT